MRELTTAGLAAAYVVYTLVESSLFAGIRARLAFVPVVRGIVVCIYCASFWCGLFVWLLGRSAITRWFVQVCALASVALGLTLARERLEHHE